MKTKTMKKIQSEQNIIFKPNINTALYNDNGSKF